MKQLKTLVIGLAFFCVFALLGCSNAFSTKTGTVAFKLPEVETLRAALSVEESTDLGISFFYVGYYKDLPEEILSTRKQVNPGEQIIFNNIESGDYTFVCSAVSADGIQLYSGKEKVTVIDGETTPVKIILKTLFTPEFVNTDIGDTKKLDVPIIVGEEFTLPDYSAEWNTALKEFVCWIYNDGTSDQGIELQPGDKVKITNERYITFTAKFEAISKIGYFAYDDHSVSKVLNPNKTVIGIVIEENAGKATKIMSLEESNKGWSTANPQLMYSYTEENADDGSIIMQWFKNNNDNSVTDNLPALSYASGYNKGSLNWYIPAKNELINIYNNKDILNTSLELISATKLNDSSYWSSTIIGNKTVYAHNFYNGSNNSYDKYGTNSCYVRCVAKFSELFGM